MLRLAHRPQVERDVELAVAWYATRHPKIASRFLAELDEVYLRIFENPLLFPTVHKDVRRALLDRFPFGVYYIVLADKVDILAVFNLRQHPDAWRLPDR